MNHFARWLAVVPAAILAWYVVVGIGMLLINVVHGWCPPAALMSNFCTASWYPPTEHGLIVFSAGLSAFAVVFVASITAPAARVRVACGVYAFGIAVAVVMAMETRAFTELAAAALAGLVAIVVVARWYACPAVSAQTPVHVASTSGNSRVD